MKKWLTRILIALLSGFLSAGISLTFSFTLQNIEITHIANAQISRNLNTNQRITSALQDITDASKLLEQGQKLYETGQFAEAVTILQKAVAGFAAQGDQLKQAIALSNLSLVYQQLGQWTQAKTAIQTSLNLLQTNSPSVNSSNRLQILAQTLEIQGRLQLEIGQAQNALQAWQLATKTYIQAQNTTGKTRSLIHQAEALQALGFYPQACQILLQALGFEHQECKGSEQVLPILQEWVKTENTTSLLLKATGLRSLGDTLQILGNLAQSEAILHQSLVLVRTLPPNPESQQEESNILLSLGNTLQAQGDREIALQSSNFSENSAVCPTKIIDNSPQTLKAKQAYEKAINYYEQADKTASSFFQITQLQAQLNALRLFVETAQWSAAQKLLPKIQPLLNSLPLSRTLVYAKINYARSLTCLQGHATQIPTELEIGQLMAVSLNQAQQLQDKRTETYARGYLGWLYEQTQQWSEAEAITQQALHDSQAIQAWDIAYKWAWQLGRIHKAEGEKEKAVIAYEVAFKTLQILRQDLMALNRDIQFSFRDEVEPIYRQFVDLLLQSETPSPENLKQARNVIEALQLAELENFFQEACLQAKPEQIDNIIDQINSKTAVIYPIILKDRIEIVLKLPGKDLYHHSTYISEREVEETVKNLRENLKQPDKSRIVQLQSQQIYDWLIKPFDSELDGEKDLAESQVKTLVFVLDGSLRNIPMAILYDNLRQRYLVERYAIAVVPGLQLLDSKPLPQGRFNALIAGVSQERQVENRTFAPLPNVTDELKQIQAVIRRHEQLPNHQFIKQNFHSQLETAIFSVVHLATHGKFSSNPEETFILTWNELLRVKELDNLLRLSNKNGANTIELLVLSACQTALGDKRAALGLAGVAARAGARSTIATLWQVNDASTAKLASQFYQQLFSNKNQLTKAEALRRAQLAILTDSRYKSPYYWAPFILVGNWV